MRLIDDSEYGPACRFSDAHVYYALSILKKKQSPLSRSELSEETRIGEGSMRKLIEVLKKWKTIEVKQTGVEITRGGCEIIDSIPVRMIDVESSSYVVGAFQQAVLVKGVAHKITNGMYQRDRGIIAGANGASVFVIRKGMLIMPKNWDMDTRDPEFAGLLRSNGMEEGDAVIVCGASDSNIATLSVISIALDML